MADDMDIDTSDQELADLFDGEGGELAIPTVRGNANLDVQDYQGPDRSSILDDEIQEDTPSTPGSGAGPATDVEGLAEMDLLAIQGDTPGMEQTTFGSSPWGPGSGQGYRPYGQMRTDMDLSGDEQQPVKVKIAQTDMMLYEPEAGAPIPPPRRDLQRNAQPSNRDVDPLTIYDRESYEYDQNSQNVIGNGIFDEEEGVTWRGRDGIFANQYALPAYIAHEPELGVQQSEMWDTVAQEWRVTQPSAGGVTLATKVGAYRPPPTNSRIELFGWTVANALASESKRMPRAMRSKFLSRAMDSLGMGTASKCRAVADRLIAMGYPPEKALVHTMAHCVMHATMNDLASPGRRGATDLPRLDALARAAPKTQPVMRDAAMQTVVPVASSKPALAAEVQALKASPTAMQGLGQIATASTPGAMTPLATTTVFTGKNMLIAGGVGLGAYLLWRNRKAIKKNATKFAKKVGL